MSTKFVLGPTIESFEIPAKSSGDTPPPPAVDASKPSIRPVNVYAFFVPKGSEPPVETRSPNDFFAGGSPSGVRSIAGENPNPGSAENYTIEVANVPAGFHFVQTILEYPEGVDGNFVGIVLGNPAAGPDGTVNFSLAG